ncbi:MAG: hypothetical protein KER_01649 [Kerstersia gyiorum]|uniref:hypothetical protein n=1 Tax=Kerstersia gyiorum TaxID=206506 RepID=UPI0030D4E38F
MCDSLVGLVGIAHVRVKSDGKICVAPVQAMPAPIQHHPDLRAAQQVLLCEADESYRSFNLNTGEHDG